MACVRAENILYEYNQREMDMNIQLLFTRKSRVGLLMAGAIVMGASSIASAPAQSVKDQPAPDLTSSELDFYKDSPYGPGEVTSKATPSSAIKARIKRQNIAKKNNAIDESKVILFGDTHVHTTYSMDAFSRTFPFIHGARGVYPPAFACDYARYISQLDFYFNTDHATYITPRHWKDTAEAVRQCNAVSNRSNSGLMAFLGFEWSQSGTTKENHYGHHNVFFRLFPNHSG